MNHLRSSTRIPLQHWIATNEWDCLTALVVSAMASPKLRPSWRSAASEWARTQLTGKQGQAFDVFERQTIEVVPGDQLMFTANHRDSGFQATNGELVTVEHVDGDGSSALRIILLDRTYVLPWPQFLYGEGGVVDEVDGMNGALGLRSPKVFSGREVDVT